MEAIYLQSMTDFVLDQKYTTTLDISQIDFYDKELNVLSKIRNYATFLKQPLQLGFFIPCDEHGNILPEPQMKPERNSFDEEDMDYDAQELYEYIQAKERVLFKGFFYKFNIDKDGKKWEYVKNEFPHVFSIDQLKRSTIEGLITGFKKEYLIELTDSAIKQIGL